jgi:hypothetical protein
LRENGLDWIWTTWGLIGWLHMIQSGLRDATEVDWLIRPLPGLAREVAGDQVLVSPLVVVVLWHYGVVLPAWLHADHYCTASNHHHCLYEATVVNAVSGLLRKRQGKLSVYCVT